MKIYLMIIHLYTSDRQQCIFISMYFSTIFYHFLTVCSDGIRLSLQLRYRGLSSGWGGGVKRLLCGFLSNQNDVVVTQHQQKTHQVDFFKRKRKQYFPVMLKYISHNVCLNFDSQFQYIALSKKGIHRFEEIELKN